MDHDDTPDAHPYGLETGMGNYYAYPTAEERLTAAIDLAVEFALDNAAIEGIDNARHVSPELFVFYDHGEDMGPVRMEKEPRYWQHLEERLASSLENPELALTEEGYVAGRSTPTAVIYEKVDPADPRMASEVAISQDASGLLVAVAPRLMLNDGAAVPPEVIKPAEVRYDPERLTDFESPRAALAEALRESFVLSDQQREPARAWLAKHDQDLQSPDRSFAVRYVGARDRFGGQTHTAMAEVRLAGQLIEQHPFTGTSKDSVVRHSKAVCQVAGNEGRSLGDAAQELGERQEREAKGYRQEPKR